MISHPNRAETPKAISIFRCPAEQAKLLKHVEPLIWLKDSPRNAYFDPFVGGGSVALTVAQTWPSARLILNDRDARALVRSFWNAFQDPSVIITSTIRNPQAASFPWL